MKIKQFEDIEGWKRARELVGYIYTVTNDGAFSKDYSLKDQIRRASTSVMANIAEGFGRQTDKEFIQFLYIALGSSTEVQSHLYIAKDLGYISDREFNKAYGIANETSRMIMGFVKYLKGTSK